jgi:16S rRNA (guanine966-N2)-methyltransferase
MITVTGGALRGRRILTRRGAFSRPTQGRVREALFSHLGDRVSEARVADLFAGSGALGIEALSRGAAFATFVEAHRHMASCLHANLESCDLVKSARVIIEEVDSILGTLLAGEFDLVFADPPYARPWPGPEAWLHLSRILEVGGFFVLESAKDTSVEAEGKDLAATFSRTYGDTRLTIYRKGVEADG